MLGFTLGLWENMSLFLDYAGIAGYGFLLMELVLNQIRYWLATPTKFVPLLLYYVLQAGQIVGQKFFDWFGVYMYLLVACKIPPHTKLTRMYG